jgi:hypothetical protein
VPVFEASSAVLVEDAQLVMLSSPVDADEHAGLQVGLSITDLLMLREATLRPVVPVAHPGARGTTPTGRFAANERLDEVRRRVQNATLGHRGRKADPLYRTCWSWPMNASTTAPASSATYYPRAG